MSGLIPKSEIDRANDDIVGVIQGYVPDLKKTGKNWSACCPLHNEKTPSFTINAEKGFFKCFGCGESGDAIKFVMLHQGVSMPQAVRIILGEIRRDHSAAPAAKKIKPISCDQSWSAENKERSTAYMASVVTEAQHPYLARNNTATLHGCFVMKSRLIIPLINNIGETVNVASMNAEGDIKYIAGKPSFGASAVLHPNDDHDGKTIICTDYAHAWRIWWAQCGRSRVLVCLDVDNLRWMLANCKSMFTHVGCDPSDADEHADMGRGVVVLPLDPYAKVDTRKRVA